MPQHRLRALAPPFCMKKKEYIRVEAWPHDHAQDAYGKGFFVEAIQVLHAWIEYQARELLVMVGCAHFSTKFVDTWDSAEELDYKDIIRSLQAIGILTKQEATDLLAINAARNKMIHRIFKEPHKHFHQGFPKDEFDRVFRLAMKWAEKMYDKNSEMGN